mmetsp:Transcript_10295/g.20306  ORF Transcript_10295/g.20306 Transcript_10295/m.20306 type:complete len:207 (+) Transcript_10295:222-842(+)
MDRVVVAVFDGAVFLAVIESVFHFADDVHPNNHVSGSLLDDLFLSIVLVEAEIIVEIGEIGFFTGKGSQYNLVGVVMNSVVFVKFVVHAVRAVITFVHLLLGGGGESCHGSLGNIVGGNVVRVVDRGTINVETSGGSKTSIGDWADRGPDLACNIVNLAIGGLVLNRNGGGSGCVVFVSLSCDLVASGVLSHDGGSLRNISSQSRR